MTLSVLLSLTLYCFAMSATPGPNNIMLASSGLSVGLKRTVPALAGVQAGFALLVVVVGLGLGQLFQNVPSLRVMLKIAGVCYMAFLAYKLWRAGDPKTADRATAPGFWNVIALQFANPKAWIMAITAIAVFAAPGAGYSLKVGLIVGVYLLVGTPCSFSWALMGHALRERAAHNQHLVWFNRGMAVLTGATALFMIVE